MKKLLCTVVLAVATLAGEEKFTVEKLTDCEVKELEAAKAKVEEAQAALAKVDRRIKRDHGDDSSSPLFGGWYATCSGNDTKVELRGGYALITKTKTERGCGAILVNSYTSGGSGSTLHNITQ